MKRRKFTRMPISELISEHKKLVRVLEKGNKIQLKNEALKQRKELNKYRRLK